jgi:enoyl-CoA hydratase/carnithine racemase
VLYSVSNRVATITLNRPERGNSITPAMVTEIIDAFERVEKDIDVQVVVLTGNGKYFCTGMDLQPGAQVRSLSIRILDHIVRRISIIFIFASFGI